MGRRPHRIQHCYLVFHKIFRFFPYFSPSVLVAGWFVCLCWVCFRIGECRPCFQLKGKNKDIHVSLYTATVSRSHLKRQVF
uniref:Uncharacterized protein n=1 Tax=Scophthalmus maximus TaxID=52904 RepID=A0A8D2ZHS4_SCOMX